MKRLIISIDKNLSGNKALHLGINMRKPRLGIHFYSSVKPILFIRLRTYWKGNIYEKTKFF
jgi:hypothetical protein